MKQTLLIFLAFFSLIRVQAQFYSEDAVDFSIGYGMSVPYEDVGFFGTGYYAQAEYVLVMSKYVDLRPYGGYIFTEMKENISGLLEPEEKATANAVLFGGKARFTLPIDWVAPYVEIGIGGSFGSFETLTANSDIEESGVFAHIPFSLGLELGPRHNVNLELTFFFHNSIKQFAGAAAIGLTFPIGYY